MGNRETSGDGARMAGNEDGENERSGLRRHGWGGGRLAGRRFTLQEALTKNTWWSMDLFRKEFRLNGPLHEIRMKTPEESGEPEKAEGRLKREREDIANGETRMPMKKRRSWRKSQLPASVRNRDEEMKRAPQVSNANVHSMRGSNAEAVAPGLMGNRINVTEGIAPLSSSGGMAATSARAAATTSAAQSVDRMSARQTPISSVSTPNLGIVSHQTGTVVAAEKERVSENPVQEEVVILEEEGHVPPRPLVPSKKGGVSAALSTNSNNLTKNVAPKSHNNVMGVHVSSPRNGADFDASKIRCVGASKVIASSNDEITEASSQKKPHRSLGPRKKFIRPSKDNYIGDGPVQTFRNLPLNVRENKGDVNFVRTVVDPTRTLALVPPNSVVDIDREGTRSLEATENTWTRRRRRRNGNLQIKGLLAANAIGLLWTKIRGHPYWPSQAISDCIAHSDQERFILAKKGKNSHLDTCIMYFGTLEIAWVNREKSCLSFTEGLRRNLHHTTYDHPTFQQALQQVRTLLSRLKARIYPSGWWSDPRSISIAESFMMDMRDRSVDALSSKQWSNAIKKKVDWVKIKGFPHWPVVPVSETVRLRRYPQFVQPDVPFTEASKPILAYFFGSRDLLWVRQNRLVDFRIGSTYFPIMSESMSSERLRAIGQAIEYIKSDSKVPAWDFEYQDDILARLEDEYYQTLEQLELEASRPKTLKLPLYEKINRSVFKEGSVPRPLSPGAVQTCSCNAETACREGGNCINRMSNVICDPKHCQPNCQNVPFDKKKIPKMSPFWTKDGRGWGLLADEAIPAGTFIVEYVGEIIDQAESDRRLKEAKKSRKQQKPKQDKTGLESTQGFYMMHVSRNYIIDAMYKGNLSRYINSSCNPNCTTQKWRDASSGETRVGIFALKDIKKGEELLYDYCFEDYGFSSKAGIRSFICLCGEDRCRMWQYGEQEAKMKRYGERISVKWDDGWYEGTIAKYLPEKELYKVDYDDGDMEELDLDGGTITYRTIPKKKKKK